MTDDKEPHRDGEDTYFEYQGYDEEIVEKNRQRAAQSKEDQNKAFRQRFVLAGVFVLMVFVATLLGVNWAVRVAFVVSLALHFLWRQRAVPRRYLLILQVTWMSTGAWILLCMVQGTV